MACRIQYRQWRKLFAFRSEITPVPRKQYAKAETCFCNAFIGAQGLRETAKRFISLYLGIIAINKKDKSMKKTCKTCQYYRSHVFCSNSKSSNGSVDVRPDDSCSEYYRRGKKAPVWMRVANWVLGKANMWLRE